MVVVASARGGVHGDRLCERVSHLEVNLTTGSSTTPSGVKLYRLSVCREERRAAG